MPRMAFDSKTSASPFLTLTFLLSASSRAFFKSGAIVASLRPRPFGFGDGQPFLKRVFKGGRPGPTLYSLSEELSGSATVGSGSFSSCASMFMAAILQIYDQARY